LGRHSGIGTLPIVYFGTEEQKKKYLPRLGRAKLLAPTRSPKLPPAPTP
jgi:alkylation response protein AidB-like acyl-CoA dehydrogenase